MCIPKVGKALLCRSRRVPNVAFAPNVIAYRALAAEDGFGIDVAFEQVGVRGVNVGSRTENSLDGHSVLASWRRCRVNDLCI
jgi:hypothetical protein